MARLTYTPWVEVEPNSEVITQIEQPNPILRSARRVTMSSRQKVVDRSIARDPKFVTGGGSQPVAYSAASGVGDKITLTLEKIGLQVQLDEDQVRDMDANVLRTEVTEIGIGATEKWIRAIMCSDQGNQAASLTVTNPYVSVFSALAYGRSASTLGGNINTAENRMVDNLLQVGFNQDVSYDDLVYLQGIVDESKFSRPGRMAWYADWGMRRHLRLVRDNNGNPLLVNPVDGALPSLLEAPLNYVHGMTIASKAFRTVPFHTGVGAPTAAFGTNGDYYRDSAIAIGTITNQFYKKSGGSWTALASGTSDGQLSKSGQSAGGFDSAVSNVGQLLYTASTANGGPLLGIGVDADDQLDNPKSTQACLWYGNADHLVVGRAYQPQFMVTEADAADTTDDTWLKYRQRDAFAIGRQEAMALLVKDNNLPG